MGRPDKGKEGAVSTTSTSTTTCRKRTGEALAGRELRRTITLPRRTPSMRPTSLKSSLRMRRS